MNLTGAETRDSAYPVGVREPGIVRVKMSTVTAQQLTAMMQQQATMAAQAMAQALPFGQGVEKAGEQVRLQRSNLLMMLTLNIPEFEGEASTLTDFLDRGGALIEQLEAAPGDPATDRAIRQLLVGRVATTIRRQIGVTANTAWDEVARRLKDQFAGARKPYQRQAVTLVSTVRRKGETPAQFASRIEEGTRMLRAKVFETAGSVEEAHSTMKVLELLVSERLRREMPDRVKKALKATPERATLKDIMDVIRDEDDEFRETAEREERWVKVEPRRIRESGGYRGRSQRYTPPTNRGPRREEKPVRPERSTWPRNDARRESRSRPKRECWECGTEGHFARECPYIFRREPGRYRSYGQASRGEPMEINFGRQIESGSGSSGEETDASTTGGSSCGSGKETKPRIKKAPKKMTGRRTGRLSAEKKEE